MTNQTTDELVARVAAAINASPSVWLRENEGYYPWEVCRYGFGSELEIVVLEQHPTHDDATMAQERLVRELQAKEAIAVVRQWDAGK